MYLETRSVGYFQLVIRFINMDMLVIIMVAFTEASDQLVTIWDTLAIVMGALVYMVTVMDALEIIWET